MPKGLNKVQLIGHLGKDPELRYTQNGVAAASFSIATGESWKDKDGNRQEKTEWHNVIAWQKLAEIMGQYLKKGSRVYISGKIQTRSYDDKNGVKRYMTEVVADDLIMLDSGEGGARRAAAEEPARAQAVPAPPSSGDDDDLPF